MSNVQSLRGCSTGMSVSVLHQPVGGSVLMSMVVT